MIWFRLFQSPQVGEGKDTLFCQTKLQYSKKLPEVELKNPFQSSRVCQKKKKTQIHLVDKMVKKKKVLFRNYCNQK